MRKYKDYKGDKSMKLILDTDIGSDVDDAIALLFLLKQGIVPDLISTVHGPVELRAKIAKELTHLCGYEVPVVYGESNPIKQKQIFTTGLENAGTEQFGNYDLKYYKKKFVDTAMQGAVILALGPLTNIATCIKEKPEIVEKIDRIYCMGNAILHEGEIIRNYRSHNFKVDPEAVDIVFSSGIPITIVSTEVCKTQAYTLQQIKDLADKPELRYLKDSATAGLGFWNAKGSYFYDPFTVAHYIRPEITEKYTRGNITLTTQAKENLVPQILEVIQRDNP
jgi:purine nucleosidase